MREILLLVIILLLSAVPVQAQGNRQAPTPPNASAPRLMISDDETYPNQDRTQDRLEIMDNRMDDRGEMVQERLENQGDSTMNRIEEREEVRSEHQEEIEQRLQDRQDLIRQRLATRSADRATQAQEHMSSVAVYIQNLLNVSDQNGGIGTQIRVIAQAQQNNQASIAGELQQLTTRNRFVRWFVGPDKTALEQLSMQQLMIEEHISQLQELQLTTDDEETSQAIEDALTALEEQKVLIDDEIAQQTDSFNLLTWLQNLLGQN